MKTHDRKRYQRLIKGLYFMRKDIIKEFESVNAAKFSEERAEIIEATVKADRNMVRNIDALIRKLHAKLGEAVPKKPEKVPKVDVRRYEA